MGLPQLPETNQIRRVAQLSLHRLGAVYVICALVGCWRYRAVEHPLSRYAACGDGQVPVLHNATARSTKVFVTDPLKQAAQNVLVRQASPVYGTADLGWLPAGATDTMFDVSGQQIAWSPGADFACVKRPNPPVDR